METKKDFVVRFSGLKSGSYDYKFELDDDFFSGYGNENLQKGKVVFDIVLEKKEKLMKFEADFSGTLNSFCDRCLKPLDIPVSGHETLYVEFGDDGDESDNDSILIIPESEYQLDLSQFMYECVATAVPMRNVHPDDENGTPTCDGDMLKFLSTEEMEPKNSAATVTNPIWDKLKDLK
ncbi:MAG: DUF177 domain-containing protein [Bacteroidales bacterium]|nr:DUF177 domain-containing protein [Bacteroidales bacterium]